MSKYSEISATVFPNPARTFVTVNHSGNVETIELYNVGGKLLQKTKEATIDIHNLQSGVYFLKITPRHGGKIVKYFIKK